MNPFSIFRTRSFRHGIRRHPVFGSGAGRAVALGAAALGWVACSESGDPGDSAGPGSEPAAPDYAELDDREFAELGAEITGQLGMNLLAQLETALSTGGPAMAVEICQAVAQPITGAATEDFPGVTVRRTSLRVRNPVNAPDATDRAVLERWASEPPTAEGNDTDLPPHEVVRSEDGTRRYYRPIMTQPVCLTCHGPETALAPAVKPMLAKHYPEDEAVGFEVGELRGAFRVEIRE